MQPTDTREDTSVSKRNVDNPGSSDSSSGLHF